MKNQILVRRYTQGLVNSIKDETEFSMLSRDLSDFQKHLREQKNLKSVLTSPFLSTTKKVQVADEILSKTSYKEKPKRFIRLLVENSRLELLSEIMDSLPEAWNEEKGIDTYEVASVVPLSQDQKKRLAEKLESIEKRPVVLKYRIDPELLGGLWIKRRNIVYDISVKGYLTKIKEKICEG